MARTKTRKAFKATTSRKRGKVVETKGKKNKDKNKNKDKGSKDVEKKQKRRYRHRNGTVAFREINMYQKTVCLLIQKAPFSRLAKEIIERVSGGNITRSTPQARLCLQEAAEDMLVRLFESGVLCAIHGKRVTLKKEDLELVLDLGGRGSAL